MPRYQAYSFAELSELSERNRHERQAKGVRCDFGIGDLPLFNTAVIYRLYFPTSVAYFSRYRPPIAFNNYGFQ